MQLGDGVRIGIGSVLGGDPQDLKFKGEDTTVEIGDGTVIREYATINRGTSQSLKTTVGRDCFIMSYVHLAHDCHVGDGVIISNGTQLAGHVTVEDRATISGLCAVASVREDRRVQLHWRRVPRAAGRAAVLKAVGNPDQAVWSQQRRTAARGLRAEAVLRELKRAYRLFFRSELNVSQAMERARHGARAVPGGPAVPVVSSRRAAAAWRS